ncbi:MAG: UbiA family prenyltransferase [Marinifilaceae bacterium]
MNYLKLMRLPNLIIIALTMYVMRYCIIRPILAINDMKLQLSDLNFLILVLSVCCMSAAGYVINDYFDTKADRLNSKKVIVGSSVTRRKAMALHTVLNFCSILLGGYISWYIGYWQFVFIYIMASGILWFYSTSYKYHFLLGSVLVSLLTATIPFMVVVFEIPMLNKAYAEVLLASKTNFNYLLYWVGAFSFFAFVGMLIGQFLRDMGALPGDREINRRSLPLVLGWNAAKFVIVSLSVLLCGALGIIWYRYLNAPFDSITPWYFGGLIIFPLLLMSYYVSRYNESPKIKGCVSLLRWVMLAGISYSFVVYYIMTSKLG